MLCCLLTGKYRVATIDKSVYMAHVQSLTACQLPQLATRGLRPRQQARA